jgi:hypothetical protein
MRGLTLEDHHGVVARIELHPNVPVDVKHRFDIAKNAFVYSWFSYELATLAEHHALAVTEGAVRARLLEDAKSKSEEENIGKAGLEWLLKAAMGRRLICYDDFRLPPAYPGGSHLNCLEFLVMIRNDLAHGRWHLFPKGSLIALELCAELLTQLYGKSPSLAR